jgi:hypothetical protein
MERLGSLGEESVFILSYLSDEERGSYAAVLRRHEVPFRDEGGEVRFRASCLGRRFLADLMAVIKHHSVFGSGAEEPPQLVLGQGHGELAARHEAHG